MAGSFIRPTFFLLSVVLLGGCGDGTGPGGGGPAENRIAFITTGNVGSMREDGSNRVMLIQDALGPNDGATGLLHWSPDGTRLLTQLTRQVPGGRLDEAVVIAGDGSGHKVAASVLYWGMGVGSWSPDGSRISYVEATSSHFGSSAIYTATPEGADERWLVTGPVAPAAHDVQPAWSPDGQEIAFLSDRVAPSMTGFGLHLFTAEEGVTGSFLVLPDRVSNFEWAPDGSRLVTLQGNGVDYRGSLFANIHLVDRASGASTRLSQQENVDGVAVWSPDGSRLAFPSIRDGNIELYVMNADGTGVQRLTDNPADDFMPAWSPDGSRLAFQTGRDGNWEIYTINLDGTGLTNLTQSSAQEVWPAWR
jgi:dipeptidyl aminopeptidase/acylaminoacyl peptidase